MNITIILMFSLLFVITDGPLAQGQKLRTNNALFNSTDTRRIATTLMRGVGGMENAKASLGLLKAINEKRPPLQQLTLKQLQNKVYDLKSGYKNNSGAFLHPSKRMKGDPGLWHLKDQYLRDQSYVHMQQRNQQC